MPKTRSLSRVLLRKRPCEHGYNAHISFGEPEESNPAIYRVCQFGDCTLQASHFIAVTFHHDCFAKQGIYAIVYACTQHKDFVGFPVDDLGNHKS